jgi:hypothetical protein
MVELLLHGSGVPFEQRDVIDLPEVNARRAASNCGRQPSALVLKHLARGRKKVQSPAAKKKRRATLKRLRQQAPLCAQEWRTDRLARDAAG